MRLFSGDKYRNTMSNVVHIIVRNENGLWYMVSELGVGEPCSEKEMVRFLKSKFKRIK